MDTTTSDLTTARADLEAMATELAIIHARANATSEDLAAALSAADTMRADLSTAQATIDSQTSEAVLLRDELASLSTDLTAARSDVDSKTAELASTSALLGQFKDKVKALLSSQAALEAQVASMHDENESLASSHSSLSSSKGALEAELAAATAALADANDAKTTLTTQVETVTAALAAKEAELTSLQAILPRFKDKVKDLLASQKTMEAQVAAAVAEKASMASSHADAIKSLRSSKADMAGELQEMTALKETLKGQLRAMSKEKASMQHTMQTEIDDLVAKVAKLTAIADAHNECGTAVQDAHAALATANDELVAANATVAELQEQLAGLSLSEQALHQAFEQATMETNAMSRAHDEAVAALSALQNLHGPLEAELQSMTYKNMQLKQDLDVMSEQVTALEHILQSKDGALDVLKDQCKAAQAALATAQAALAEKDAIVAAKDAQLAEQDALLSESDALMAELDTLHAMSRSQRSSRAMAIALDPTTIAQEYKILLSDNDALSASQENLTEIVSTLQAQAAARATTAEITDRFVAGLVSTLGLEVDFPITETSVLQETLEQLQGYIGMMSEEAAHHAHDHAASLTTDTSWLDAIQEADELNENADALLDQAEQSKASALEYHKALLALAKTLLPLGANELEAAVDAATDDLQAAPMLLSALQSTLNAVVADVATLVAACNHVRPLPQLADAGVWAADVARGTLVDKELETRVLSAVTSRLGDLGVDIGAVHTLLALDSVLDSDAIVAAAQARAHHDAAYVNALAPFVGVQSLQASMPQVLAMLSASASQTETLAALCHRVRVAHGLQMVEYPTTQAGVIALWEDTAHALEEASSPLKTLNASSIKGDVDMEQLHEILHRVDDRCEALHGQRDDKASVLVDVLGALDLARECQRAAIAVLEKHNRSCTARTRVQIAMQCSVQRAFLRWKHKTLRSVADEKHAADIVALKEEHLAQLKRVQKLNAADQKPTPISATVKPTATPKPIVRTKSSTVDMAKVSAKAAEVVDQLTKRRETSTAARFDHWKRLADETHRRTANLETSSGSGSQQSTPRIQGRRDSLPKSSPNRFHVAFNSSASRGLFPTTTPTPATAARPRVSMGLPSYSSVKDQSSTVQNAVDRMKDQNDRLVRKVVAAAKKKTATPSP
ncbi:hypothetical protein SPRG_08439 [Saprolegnia parasitica CBS 223.65]|uniref:Uncharacterized protein n=1 Tax=Saprolegnia parasitica (strain CBS 223.65) TaxID=695850 RepID=A0A067C6D1_SAPPC|nr:hypothetical protein SPRG_08439 [Saprolegnia parasitica CBS 223.65]KDO26078.1 hypothetical protein SPRG_08439 [Saprolegnia parasitica CBS 223.65]|eukprot:XP_012203074.1 hypothetical protein SPRG_08439 [Saprolegnia parasitica CBS 223.65]